ncbi:MAG TPA: serine/threonine-protein kinase [Coleofasciculaceae cyanobacterium]
MSYCLNPSCPAPQNPAGTNFCRTCGSKLLLKDRYRAINPLGQGGFGKTFLAVDEDKPSQPRCVIKQFFPQAQGTNTVQKAAELFTQEAIRLDELGKHPQIPELLAYFSQDNQQYLVQEFIDGSDLAQELTSNGPFNEAQVRSLLTDLLPVLQFVHQHQVIHRDIKPENIIRRSSNNQLVLVDFGASKVATGTALARTGTAIGSAGYAAPEQSYGRAVFASDIYGLGITCIHLLTGIHPFDLFDPSENAWVWRQALKKPVSDSLGRILDKMTENAINQRYQSAAEVLKDLNPQTPQAAAVKPQKSVTPATASPPYQPTATKPSGAIDAELAEVSSQFLSPPTPKSQSQKPTPQQASPPSPPTGKNQIDRELEELKSQFLNSTKPKTPPSQT